MAQEKSLSLLDFRPGGRGSDNINGTPLTFLGMAMEWDWKRTGQGETQGSSKDELRCDKVGPVQYEYKESCLEG